MVVLLELLIRPHTSLLYPTWNKTEYLCIKIWESGPLMTSLKCHSRPKLPFLSFLLCKTMHSYSKNTFSWFCVAKN